VSISLRLSHSRVKVLAASVAWLTAPYVSCSTAADLMFTGRFRQTIVKITDKSFEPTHIVI